VTYATQWVPADDKGSAPLAPADPGCGCPGGDPGGRPERADRKETASGTQSLMLGHN